MSATIPSNKQLNDLLKPTGFNCPEDLKYKTFYEATSGGDITYVHKVELKFDNFSLSYYGQESNHNILVFDFDKIANNSTGRDDVRASGDLQELLSFYPNMLSPHTSAPFTKASKIAYHIYLKDADTENLVQGIGICGSTSAGSREVGILFNSGTQDKYFNNTIVLEWA